MQEFTTESNEQTRARLGDNLNDEAEITRLLDEINEAFRAKDLDRIMSLYADDVVAYDMMPPLEFRGKAAYRVAWRKGFEMMGEVQGFERSGLRVLVSGDLGVAHYLCHMRGTMKDGKAMDMWTRYTGVFRRLGGKWLIAHEQFSVPINEDDKPQWGLKPESGLTH